MSADVLITASNDHKVKVSHAEHDANEITATFYSHSLQLIGSVVDVHSSCMRVSGGCAL